MFEYNSEYQTSQYAVASNIQFEVVKKTNLLGQNQEMIDSYNYPFSSVELFNESISPNYDGKFFVSTKAKLDKNQELDYYLYYNSDEQPDATGARNLYLQAQLPGTATGVQEVTDLRALDVRNLIWYSGRDTTIQENGVSYSLIYAKINLKYCSEVKDGDLVYKSATTSPFNIYVFKEDY
jgi:hypothetical protein